MKFVRSRDRLENRPTIGMLTALLKGPTEINLWQGVADRAQEVDVNLLCFSAGIPGWPRQYEAQKNILFDFAGQQNVDGLLVWSNIFSHTLDRKELGTFCQRYSPLPLISMGLVLPQYPSIWIDMVEGMRSLLCHLIKAHGCQKIAFIKGLEVSQDAEDRYRAYVETLSDFGLKVDPGLVATGDFRRPSAVTAMEKILSERGSNFDAVVAANDNMAIGALQVLQAHGIRVPQDVILTGFDDIEETQAVLPSLTTVRAPWHELGSHSVDTLLAILSGEPQPEQIRLQTELVLRQSCGCLPDPLLAGEIDHRRQLQQRLVSERQTDRLNQIIHTMSTTYDIDRLMDLLALELSDLGIRSCYLSLYESKAAPEKWSRLILASSENGRVPLESEGRRFPTRDLVPQGLLPNTRRYAFDVEALYFKDEHIGFVLFELGSPDGEVYTVLRGHLSSAIKSARLVQATLQAEARAVKADQLKTRLLANVSHELRTPLNIIVGFSQTAMSIPNPYGVELPEKLLKDLEHIYDSGEHLIRLINDLLDLSSAEIGELDLWMEPISLGPLIEEVFQSMAGSSSQSHGTINWQLEVPPFLPVINADPIRLRQVLLNLLSNARKFTPDGCVTLGAEVRVPHLHLWVKDTGVGIPIDLQEHIFEPFVTEDQPGHRRRGIGLGLTITRRLVALHGGALTLESQPGQGSTFHVYLPLPNLSGQMIQPSSQETIQPVLLWLSASDRVGPALSELCRNRGLELCRVKAGDDIGALLARVTPTALAWDLANARPADWLVIQDLRIHPKICQLPFLLFGEEEVGGTPSRPKVTDVLLKPLSRKTFLEVIEALQPPGPTGLILIVDDDLQALEYYRSLIARSLPDYAVQTASGGAEAITMLQEGKPDLVVLDLMMPEVDGFAVLDRLRADPKTSMVPVIVLSGRVLTYEDVKRLDHPRILYQTKQVLSGQETIAGLEKLLTIVGTLPQPTSILVKQALAYLHQNYGRTITLKEITETVGTSRSYLSRIFHDEMGISLWEYLNRYRIIQAKELLAFTDDRITDIAARVGFEDIGYFGRVFHRCTGLSPRAYRQQSRSSQGISPTGQ